MSFAEKIADAVTKRLLDPVLRANYLSAGEVFWVFEDSDTGLQKMQRDHPKNTFVTMAEAYAAATTNRHDVINVGAASAHSITTGIAWSKSRLNVVGLDGGDRRLQQGSRLVGAAADNTGYVIKITGTRNSFRNIKFEQQSTDAAGLTVAQFGGEGTLVKNCSFVFGTVTNMDGSETTTYEVVMGEDSGTFINCTFGNDTLDTTGGRAVMAIDQVTSGQPMKGCQFIDCVWTIASDDADAHFIRVIATSDVNFINLFVNPIFIASINGTMGSIILDDAIESISGLVAGTLIFINPATNCTALCGTVTDNVKVVGLSMADSGNADVSATVGIAQTPT